MTEHGNVSVVPFDVIFRFTSLKMLVLFCFFSSSGQVPYAALGGQEIVMILKNGDRLDKPEGCSDEKYVRNCAFHSAWLLSDVKWVPGNLTKGLTLRCISIPFEGIERGGVGEVQEILLVIRPTNSRIRFNSMDYLIRRSRLKLTIP